MRYSRSVFHSETETDADTSRMVYTVREAPAGRFPVFYGDFLDSTQAVNVEGVLSVLPNTVLPLADM